MPVLERELLCEVLFHRELLLNKLTLTLVNKTYADNFDKHQLHNYLVVSRARDHLRHSNEAIFEFLEHDKLLAKVRSLLVYGLVSILALQVDAFESLAYALNFTQVSAEDQAMPEARYKNKLATDYPEFLKLILEISEYRYLLSDMGRGGEKSMLDDPLAMLQATALLPQLGAKSNASKRARLLTDFAIDELLNNWLVQSNNMLSNMVEFFEKIKFGAET